MWLIKLSLLSFISFFLNKALADYGQTYWFNASHYTSPNRVSATFGVNLSDALVSSRALEAGIQRQLTPLVSLVILGQVYHNALSPLGKLSKEDLEHFGIQTIQNQYRYGFSGLLEVSLLQGVFNVFGYSIQPVLIYARVGSGQFFLTNTQSRLGLVGEIGNRLQFYNWGFQIALRQQVLHPLSASQRRRDSFLIQGVTYSF